MSIFEKESKVITVLVIGPFLLGLICMILWAVFGGR
jgi:hypothetical protein